MKLKVRLYLLISVILGVILSVFYAVVQNIFVDSSTLLVTSSPAVTALRILIALALIFVLAASFITFKKVSPMKQEVSSLFSVIASWLLAALFAAYFIGYLVTSIRKFLLFSPEITAVSQLSKILYFSSVIAAVFCVVYFIFLAARKSTQASAGLSLLSVFPVLYFSLRLIFYFIQTSASVNISGRKLMIVCLCLCTAFFLCEARLHTSHTIMKDGKKERAGLVGFYLSTGLGAIVTLLLFVPNPLFIGTALYIVSRIYTYSRNM